jgi:putative Mn2+ efflux pump MntP
MDLFLIMGIAVGLSMDALAVSVANGFSIKDLKLRHAFLISFSFGLFQAVMPIIGWALGLAFSKLVASFDHWVVFGLLWIIGLKMIYESFRRKKGCETRNCLHFPTLMLLSFATSIDALAAGLSFAFLGVKILVAVSLIGGITALLCFLGVFLGNKIGHFFENKLEFIGGIILLGIGAKILIEHLIQ